MAQSLIEVYLSIPHIPINLQFQTVNLITLQEILDSQIEEGQVNSYDDQSYGIYNKMDQKLYQGKELNKMLNQIKTNENKAELTILKRGIPKIYWKISISQLGSSFEPPSDFSQTIQTKIVSLHIYHQSITIEYKVEINQILYQFILQLKQDEKNKLTDQTYGLYYPALQKLYKDEQLQVPFKNIVDLNNSKNIELTLIRKDEFDNYQTLYLLQQTPVNMINIKIKMIDKPQLDFILEINKYATLIELIEKLYTRFGRKREEVSYELQLQYQPIKFGEKKQLRTLNEFSIEDYTEIQVKSLWLIKQINIRIKVVDGVQSQNQIMEIDQNTTWEAFVDKLYDHLELSKKVVEFQLSLNGKPIEVISKAHKKLAELGIIENTEIEVKKQLLNKIIKIRIKLVDGKKSIEYIMEIDQNANWQTLVDKLYGIVGKSNEVLEFLILLNEKPIEVKGYKAIVKNLAELGITDNTEIVVKEQYIGGANIKKCEILYN